MSRYAKLVPVAIMGVLAVGYVLARDRIVAELRYAPILEFPLGALIVAILLWAALSRRQPVRPAPWRRHEQIVRPLPDPALARDIGALERWLESAEAPDAAADVIARSAAKDDAEHAAMRASILHDMSNLASRRKRESYLEKQLRQGV